LCHICAGSGHDACCNEIVRSWLRTVVVLKIDSVVVCSWFREPKFPFAVSWRPMRIRIENLWLIPDRQSYCTLLQEQVKVIVIISTTRRGGAHHVDDVLVGCRFSMSSSGSLVAAAEMRLVFAAFLCSFSNFLTCFCSLSTWSCNLLA
jgi:hypothetical protein